MIKYPKSIGKQLVVFALIASIFNIYALNIWCSLNMADHIQPSGLACHTVKTGNASGEAEHCPHRGSSESEKNSCADHHSFFCQISTRFRIAEIPS
jgi:hypothetical protein